jgi:hypothetical protein
MTHGPETERAPLSGSRTTSDDPHVEPDNSTVDDWFGQQVQRDQELADELLGETGDETEAAERFAQQTNEDRPDSLPTDQRRT